MVLVAVSGCTGGTSNQTGATSQSRSQTVEPAAKPEPLIPSRNELPEITVIPGSSRDLGIGYPDLPYRFVADEDISYMFDEIETTGTKVIWRKTELDPTSVFEGLRLPDGRELSMRLFYNGDFIERARDFNPVLDLKDGNKVTSYSYKFSDSTGATGEHQFVASVWFEVPEFQDTTYRSGHRILRFEWLFSAWDNLYNDRDISHGFEHLLEEVTVIGE
jgi:hypothetical protein